MIHKIKVRSSFEMTISNMHDCRVFVPELCTKAHFLSAFMLHETKSSANCSLSKIDVKLEPCMHPLSASVVQIKDGEKAMFVACSMGECAVLCIGYGSDDELHRLCDANDSRIFRDVVYF
jgi:hypothetical protein